MPNNHAWWRMLPVIAAILFLTSCIYTEDRPLPVRFVNSPNGPEGAWACQPVGGGACLANPNYEGKRGCNGSWSNVCKTQGGACQCVPY